MYKQFIDFGPMRTRTCFRLRSLMHNAARSKFNVCVLELDKLDRIAHIAIVLQLFFGVIPLPAL